MRNSDPRVARLSQRGEKSITCCELVSSRLAQGHDDGVSEQWDDCLDAIEPHTLQDAFLHQKFVEVSTFAMYRPALRQRCDCPVPVADRRAVTLITIEQRCCCILEYEHARLLKHALLGSLRRFGAVSRLRPS